VSQSLSSIGDKKPIATSDCDTDTDADADAENAFPAALSGSQAKATGFAGGYLRVPSMCDNLEVKVFSQPDGGEG
jgi:hypothetical protein